MTALGNHVLAKRDSLLRDPQSMVPVEALSRLRHAPLPSSSAAILPTPLLDEALSKSRASANDALVKKSLHPPRIPKKVSSGQGRSRPRASSVDRGGESPVTPRSQGNSQHQRSSNSGHRGKKTDPTTDPTTTEDLAARVAESGIPEDRRESAAAVKVGGCLSVHWRRWQAVGADSWTVSVLRDGYRLPFESPPLLTRTPVLFPAYHPGSP